MAGLKIIFSMEGGRRVVLDTFSFSQCKLIKVNFWGKEKDATRNKFLSIPVRRNELHEQNIWSVS